MKVKAEAPVGTAEAIPLPIGDPAMLTFEPNASHYQMYSVLGRCCDDVGTVHLSRHEPSGMLMVVKKFDMDKAREEASLIQHEILLTRQLQHPNIIPYHVTFVLGPEVCVVTPLMAYGSCKDLVNNHFSEGLPELAIAFILRDILQGLDYIHKKGYIHRSVRASHILVSNTGKACLSGLRYACHIVQNGRWQRTIHQFPHSTSKNLNWLSPELLEQNLQGYNEKSDIYSVGITACELANGIVPFADMPSTLMLTEKLRGSSPQLLDRTTFPAIDEDGDAVHHTDSGVGDSVASTSNMQNKEIAVLQQRRFTESFHQLVGLCLQREPLHRPTAPQILHHSFFKQCRRSSTGVPELLHPVRPICDKRGDSQDDLALVLASEKLRELDIDPEEWDF